MEDSTENVNLPEENDSEVANESGDSIVQPRRSGRKRIRAAPAEVRTFSIRPRKLPINANLKDIENYYLDKKVYVSCPSLETIFEEPNKTVMSVKKFRRYIYFGDDPSVANKLKVKKRSMKAKKVCVKNKVTIKHKKTNDPSMELLLRKLEESYDEQES